MFEFQAPYTVVEFMKREDGTKPDRYLISNDPGVVPANSAFTTASPWAGTSAVSGADVTIGRDNR